MERVLASRPFDAFSQSFRQFASSEWLTFVQQYAGPGKIPSQPTAFSLWALGTALEHCSVETLLSATTALLLERLVSEFAFSG